MKIILAALLILSLSPSLVYAADTLNKQGYGTIYGKHSAFQLTPPKNWIVDSLTGADGGQEVVYYPVSTGKAGPVTCFAEIVDKTDRYQRVEDFVNKSIAELRAKDPDLVFFKAGEIANMMAKRALIYHFFYTGNTGKAAMAVAYYDAPKTMDLIIMRASDIGAFNASLPAFKELAGSYFYVTSNVHIP